eukprot:GHVL01034159.1.p1 GENE.GHVL01034159.1~~GHVL01034159.1.p1  ORF type:complete len:122 (+),score=14.66 GHVL01034159.1:223-588(+)
MGKCTYGSRTLQPGWYELRQELEHNSANDNKDSKRYQSTIPVIDTDGCQNLYKTAYTDFYKTFTIPTPSEPFRSILDDDSTVPEKIKINRKEEKEKVYIDRPPAGMPTVHLSRRSQIFNYD